MRKRGILFTVTTFLLLLGLLALSHTFQERTQQFEEDARLHVASQQLRVAVQDVTGNAYGDLLPLVLQPIRRTTVTILAFNNTQLSPQLDHDAAMRRYRDFIQQNYSALTGLSIQLAAFNSSFAIDPYGASFRLNRTILRITTPDNDDIQEIRLTAVVSPDNGTRWTADEPNDNSGIPVTVTYYDTEGDRIYTASHNLKADKDNDNNPVNRQFYQNFNNGSYIGSIETKFGKVNSTTGVLYVTIDTLSANITSLEIHYRRKNTPTILKAGRIIVSSPITNLSRTSDIILAEE